MTTDLARHNGDAPLALSDTMTLAETFVRSGFFSDAKDAAQAVVKIMAGRELGFGPMSSMTGVYIVKGKVSLSANLIAAAVKRSGRYNYRVTDMTDARCAITFLEHGQPCGESVFTLEDAKAAALTSNETWRKFPRNMLFARALSNGARWYCPDVFGGPLYTPDELGATVDGETGEVIDVPVTVTTVPSAPGNGNRGTPPSDWPSGPRDGATAWVDGKPVTAGYPADIATPVDYTPDDVADRATPPEPDPAPPAEPNWSDDIAAMTDPLAVELAMPSIVQTTTGYHTSGALALAAIRLIELSQTSEDLARAARVMGEYKGKLATKDRARVDEAGKTARAMLAKVTA